MDATPAGDVAREYCIKHPAAPSIQLARMLRKDHPALFATVEAARTRVRYYRSAHGKHGRQYCARPVKRIKIPAPEPPSFSTFTLGDDIKRWLILADLHVPFHVPEAIELALAWATRKETRCDGVLLLGDVGDFYQVSSWTKDPRRRRFSDEMVAVGQMLDVIQQRLKPKRVIWRASNHERRFELYLMAHAPEVFGIGHFSIPSFMELERRRVEWIPRGCPIRHHALTLLHGDEFGGGRNSPVNPARTAYLKSHDCVVIGHFHRSSEHSEPSLRGVVVTAWSVGALCELRPEYAPVTNWNHGLAILESGSDWRIHNYRVINGKIF